MMVSVSTLFPELEDRVWKAQEINNRLLMGHEFAHLKSQKTEPSHCQKSMYKKTSMYKSISKLSY